jgi:5-methylcytosine-specific restriction endonuclease McrA
MDNLPKHVENYLAAFGFSGMEFMPCEVCGSALNDVHHIQPRSSFGSKRKKEQDHIDNLCGLCRDCHTKAHGPESRLWKEKLTQIAKSRAFQRI